MSREIRDTRNSCSALAALMPWATTPGMPRRPLEKAQSGAAKT